MNILIPDGWLREYITTDATPKQIKEYLSLCGPSVERISTGKGETVYDIEITSNRPDMMSVMGIAREAAAILPRFGIDAQLPSDKWTRLTRSSSSKLKLHVTTDPELNPRWTSVIFDTIKIKPSPDWLKKRLELVGVRSLNNVIDITNYLMHAYGQPAHVFDYDRIENHVMILRSSHKGETLTTLDGKTHTLPGGDIVIEDGSGKLIDLCGIMGGENSAITPDTKRVVLFLQTYNPERIRKTSMSLSHRTEASGLFEKGLDTELVLPVFLKGIQLMQKHAEGKLASAITDLYPEPYHPPTVGVVRKKIDSYIGVHLDTKEIHSILTALGCIVKITETEIAVQPPSFRRDITIDVDVIEELARIYGYHNIRGVLPEREPPGTIEEPVLGWEQKIKTKLRDWGFTETYTYSMISDGLMEVFSIPKDTTYHIANPLSEEWISMRPTLLPSMLLCMKQNMPYESDVKLFELSMTYAHRTNNLPLEESTLIVAVSGARYGKIKGVAEALFSFFDIDFPQTPEPANHYYQKNRSLRIGNFGQMGEIDPKLLLSMALSKPITVLELSVDGLVKHAKTTKQYIPISKYPASFEDLAFVVPEKTYIAPIVHTIGKLDPLIAGVSLFDSYKNIRTFHITYQDKRKNLTADDIGKIREKIIRTMKKEYRAELKMI